MAKNEMPTVCNFQGDRILCEEFHTSFFYKVKVHQMLIIVLTNICIRRKLPVILHDVYDLGSIGIYVIFDYYIAESRRINIDSRSELEIFLRNRTHD